MNDHHQKKQEMAYKEPIDSMTETEANEPSRFSGGDSFITHRAYIAGSLKIIASVTLTKTIKNGDFRVHLKMKFNKDI